MPATPTDIYVYLSDGSDALVTQCTGDPTLEVMEIWGAPYRDIHKAATPLATAATQMGQVSASASFSGLWSTSNSSSAPTPVNQAIFVPGVAAIPGGIDENGGRVINQETQPPYGYYDTYENQFLYGSAWLPAISDELAHVAPRQALKKISWLVFPTSSGLNMKFPADTVVGMGFAPRE